MFINDVVAGKGHVLNPQRKTARELKIPAATPRLPVPFARAGSIRRHLRSAPATAEAA